MNSKIKTAKGFKYDLKYDLDDPKRTLLHGEIIKSKPFLKKLYIEWYKNFLDEIKNIPSGKMIEIGSGGGFLKEIIPEVITSDILPLENCDMTFSAENLPFAEDELSAIFMVNVLHHIPDPAKFFLEAEKKLKQGGMIVMVETAYSVFSKIIYQNFHHEPFDTKAKWELTGGGPLSASNQALPWIIFERDRKKFDQLFPHLKVISIKHHSPFRYLLSGGVSRKTLVPDWSFPIFASLEKLLTPFMKYLGMFETIKIKKN
ncbi:MAG TPA: class I SAM-dependent methyltransferase [Bacteroidia bacterium]|nr:class I SAM-dependent methyltransferase [Bacteroidia bacterium]